MKKYARYLYIPVILLCLTGATITGAIHYTIALGLLATLAYLYPSFVIYDKKASR